MKRTQQQIRGQTIDLIITERNLTLLYQTVPGHNRNVKLGNDFDRFFVGKETTMRDEVDSQSIDSS